MNKLSRTAHEDRSLWTIDPLSADERAGLVTMLWGGSLPFESGPLACAHLAGAQRTVAFIARKPTRSGPDLFSARATAKDSTRPAQPASMILLSHPSEVIANDIASDLADARTGSSPKRSVESAWFRLGCPTADGLEDILYLQLAASAPDAVAVQQALSVWPALRSRCLDELSSQPVDEDPPADGPDAALLWMVLSKIPAAVLVVNAAGLILRMNPQARRLIHEGRVLARGRGGLTAATDMATRMLRDAVKSCTSVIKSEAMLLLPTADGSRVPTTLFRFPGGQATEDLVTLMIPVPPEPDQVERVARSLGLTATEARVAALLQRGMSNRVAALCMGVQEQSFATYSKRVLSKLNVTSRAEIAQMLTWQSSLPTTEGLSS